MTLALERWTWQNLDALTTMLERHQASLVRLLVEDRTAGGSTTISGLDWRDEQLGPYLPSADPQTSPPPELQPMERIDAALQWVREATAGVTVGRQRTFSVRATDGKKYIGSCALVCLPIQPDADASAAGSAATPAAPPAVADQATAQLLRAFGNGAAEGLRMVQERFDKAAEANQRMVDFILRSLEAREKAADAREQAILARDRTRQENHQQELDAARRAAAEAVANLMRDFAGLRAAFAEQVEELTRLYAAQLENARKEVETANARTEQAYQHREKLVAHVVELQGQLADKEASLRQELELARQKTELAKSFLERVSHGVEVVAAGKLDVDPRLMRLAEALREAPEDVREAVLAPELPQILKDPELAKALGGFVTRFVTAWKESQAQPS